MLKDVKLRDNTSITVEICGEGSNLLLPVNGRPVEGEQAEEMKKWGADPALGRTLIDELSCHFRVIAFDYEGQVMTAKEPRTLTPANISDDFLAIADAADARRFAYYGYSWLALSGMQLAIRTNRLTALIMGGFPPIGGPYREMLTVTKATHIMATESTVQESTNNLMQADYDSDATDDFDWSTVSITLNESQTKPFVTLYEELQSFDDVAAQAKLSCPRLCFAGTADKIVYGKRWGDIVVDIAGPLMQRRQQLETSGWEVVTLEGLDHTQAMQASHVLPIVQPWLLKALSDSIQSEQI